MYQYLIAETGEEIGTRLLDVRQLLVNMELNLSTLMEFRYHSDEKVITLPVTARFLLMRFEMVSGYLDYCVRYFLNK